jgi:anti-sigma factor RsiW
MRTVFGECDRARQWISAGLDGELSEFESALLDGHLAGCKACAAFSIETRSMTNELRLAPMEPFEVHMMPSRRPRRLALRLSPVAASLAVAAVAIGSILASVRVGPFVASNTSRRPSSVSGTFGAAPMSGMRRIELQRRSTSANQARQPHGPASRL